MYKNKFYTTILMMLCAFCGLLNAQNGDSNSKIANFTQGKEYFVLEKPLAQFNGKFVKITGAGLKESHPHDVIITKEAPNYNNSNK